MANGTTVQPNHTKFIVAIIGILSLVALGAGTWLIYKGYQTGELLIQTGGMGVSGLLGMLGISKPAAPSAVPQPEPPPEQIERKP